MFCGGEFPFSPQKKKLVSCRQGRRILSFCECYHVLRYHLSRLACQRRGQGTHLQESKSSVVRTSPAGCYLLSKCLSCCPYPACLIGCDQLHDVPTASLTQFCACQVCTKGSISFLLYGETGAFRDLRTYYLSRNP